MPRMSDFECRRCHAVLIDVYQHVHKAVTLHREVARGVRCRGVCDEVFLPRHVRNASAFGASEVTLAFRKPDGTYSIPMRNDAPTPPGYERIEMRTLREVDAFERRSGLRSERAHFDRGNARGFDDGDGLPAPSCLSPAARADRERRFLRAWEASR